MCDVLEFSLETPIPDPQNFPKMWFDEAGEVVEMFRSSFPLSVLFFVPIFIIISPVGGAHEFAVYRMQQYDLQGASYGKI